MRKPFERGHIFHISKGIAKDKKKKPAVGFNLARFCTVVFIIHIYSTNEDLVNSEKQLRWFYFLNFAKSFTFSSVLCTPFFGWCVWNFAELCQCLAQLRG